MVNLPKYPANHAAMSDLAHPVSSTNIETEELLSYFRRGLIPGPSESEEEFLKRVRVHPSLPDWQKMEPLPSEWGFSVDWVPLVYSSKRLLPWEGAIFWVTKEGSHIQLHPKLYTKPLFGNSLTDILHHESIHAAREAFDEPQFEEVLAYLTSSSCWKRWLGPLFQRVWEFPLLLLSLFFFPYSVPIPVFFLFRLIYKKYLIRKAKKKIPLPVLVCLTDREIKTFASRRPYISDLSLRGRLIQALLDFFRNNR